MGTAGNADRRQPGLCRSAIGCRLFAGAPERSRFVGRRAVHGNGLPEGFLFEVPPVPPLFSDVRISSLPPDCEGVVRFPLSMTASMSKYIAGKRLRGVDKFPLVMMLEPLHACNLTCTGCGRIREYADTI